MRQKRNYCRLEMHTVSLRNQHRLLAGSGQQTTGPSANYMQDPGITETE